jgi:hypothetical protein
MTAVGPVEAHRRTDFFAELLDHGDAAVLLSLGRRMAYLRNKYGWVLNTFGAIDEWRRFFAAHHAPHHRTRCSRPSPRGARTMCEHDIRSAAFERPPQFGERRLLYIGHHFFIANVWLTLPAMKVNFVLGKQAEPRAVDCPVSIFFDHGFHPMAPKKNCSISVDWIARAARRIRAALDPESLFNNLRMGCLQLLISGGRLTIGASLDHRCPLGVGRLVPPLGIAGRRVSRQVMLPCLPNEMGGDLEAARPARQIK